jgi:hypothetical protein
MYRQLQAITLIDPAVRGRQVAFKDMDRGGGLSQARGGRRGTRATQECFCYVHTCDPS